MYEYSNHRSYVFTDEGQKDFLKVRDTAMELIDTAGAATMENLTRGLTGDSWNHLACVDRLIELGELTEASNPLSSAGQHRLFVSKLWSF